ncbi:uncharacterized protein LOC108632658 isoform X1 [Ceratina calcarata]|uniref:Uncharacterized protein LOC108632658 isoform X1 n=1 Tax=Ceratina calcarata TaxID=156304 RepID=A0AAJ7JG87_9HYME|nr:uncharacterized protein LOC108632658 isoform X1 [Ceratina calcarata]
MYLRDERRGSSEKEGKSRIILKHGDTKVATTPEKKVVEEEKKVVQEVDEDSKASENGDAQETKENGSNEEKEESESKEPESTENGDSTDAPVDSCCIKRKSTTLSDATSEDGSATDGASPEKKSKLEEKCAETESNGEAEATA